MSGKQRIVNFILSLWVVMPRRAKLWAFMNDGTERYTSYWQFG